MEIKIRKIEENDYPEIISEIRNTKDIGSSLEEKMMKATIQFKKTFIFSEI